MVQLPEMHFKNGRECMKNNIFSTQLYRIVFFAITILFYQSVKPMLQYASCGLTPGVYGDCVAACMPSMSVFNDVMDGFLGTSHSQRVMNCMLGCLTEPRVACVLCTFAARTAIITSPFICASYLLYKRCQSGKNISSREYPYYPFNPDSDSDDD
jgi:hypothetical protein